MASWDSMTPANRRKLQGGKLKNYLRKEIIPYHPHYRKHAESLKRIRSVDDFTRCFPLTQKKDILGHAEDFVLQPTPSGILRNDPLKLVSAFLRGRGSVAEMRRQIELEYRDAVYTLTTGRSTARTPFVFSAEDLNGFVQTATRRAFILLGLPAGTRGVSVFPVAVHLAHVFVVEGARAVPAPVIPLVGLSTEQRIAAVESLKPVVLFGVPSYVERLVTLAQLGGKDFSSVTHVVVGGGGISQVQRERIQQALRNMGSTDPVIVSSYGFTEARMAFIECVEGARQNLNVGYHLFPDLGIMEAVRIFESSGGVIQTVESCEEGQEGELLWTPLQGHGSVVLRWRTGDFARIEESPCPACGRSVPRIIAPIRRRSSDMVKNIKGTLVDFNNAIELFNSDNAVLAWQLSIDELAGEERVSVFAALRDGEDEKSAAQRLRISFKIQTEVSIDEFIVEPYEKVIERLGIDTELKERLVLDNRAR